MEPAGDIDELALVRELRSRHNTAVATFLQRYRPLLLHCIGNFEQDHSTRDDLLQGQVGVVERDRAPEGLICSRMWSSTFSTVLTPTPTIPQRAASALGCIAWRGAGSWTSSAGTVAGARRA